MKKAYFTNGHLFVYYLRANNLYCLLQRKLIGGNTKYFKAYDLVTMWHNSK